MSSDSLKQNIEYLKEIMRELYIFTNQFDIIKNLETNKNVVINREEKRLLKEVNFALTSQIKILNNSIPRLLENIGFFKKMPENIEKKSKKTKLIQVRYDDAEKNKKTSFTIEDQYRKEFLKNLSKSKLSINQLKKKFVIQNKGVEFGRANIYAKMSNKLFRNFSNKLIAKGYFNKLNRDLRKINSPFVARTYVSMILFTTLIGFMVGIFLFIGLLFFNVSALFPFLTPVEGSLLIRFLKIFWILFATPLLSGTLIYFYPSSEGKNLGAKITQELPFVAIHMSAVAASGIEPIKIFNILLTSGEYRYTNIEIRKLVNLINFHGKDLVSALKQTASTSSSLKLKELLDGLATSITSGGDLHHFLDKHAETLLFDYRLERERYTKTSETFMDIYISIVIAAPMILLILFVIMGSTGALGNFMGLSVGVLSLLIILAITILNLGFLMFLKLKQPVL